MALLIIWIVILFNWIKNNNIEYIIFWSIWSFLCIYTLYQYKNKYPNIDTDNYEKLKWKIISLENIRSIKWLNTRKWWYINWNIKFEIEWSIYNKQTELIYVWFFGNLEKTKFENYCSDLWINIWKTYNILADKDKRDIIFQSMEINKKLFT